MNYNKFIQDLLLEMSLRTYEGYPNFKDKEHIKILRNILDEWGYESEINDLLIKNLTEESKEESEEKPVVVVVGKKLGPDDYEDAVEDEEEIKRKREEEQQQQKKEEEEKAPNKHVHEGLILLKEGSTAATTFFHEIITGIACVDPSYASNLKTGEDVLKAFNNNYIIAVNVGLSKVDHNKLKQATFFSPDIKVPEAIKKDAIKSANNLRTKINKGKKPVFWTGPTNDKSKYGAADIVVNGKGISLKYGKGQLKNLTIGSFGRSILNVKENIMKTIFKEYKKDWDKLTQEWLKIIVKEIKKTKDTEAIKIINQLKKNDTWNKYQQAKLSQNEIDILTNAVGLTKNKKYNEFRHFCKKLIEKYRNKDWIKVRRDIFEKIFGSYFKGKEEIIRMNLHKLFKKQLSVQKNDLIYSANGGKDLKVIPNEKKFEAGLKNLKFDYKLSPSKSGYEFKLIIQTANSKKLVGEIIILFRFKCGQMNGFPVTSSSGKFYITDWTEIFE